MIGGQGHLGGADQIQPILLDGIGLFLAAGEIAGPFHGLAFNEVRWDERNKTLAHEQVQGQAQEGHLEQHPFVLEEVEPRARELNPPFDVEDIEELAEFDVVPRLEREGRR